MWIRIFFLFFSLLSLIYGKAGDFDKHFGVGQTGMVMTDVGSLSTDIASSIAIRESGRIIVAGSSYDGKKDSFAMVGYQPDGTLDLDFGFGGKVITSDEIKANAYIAGIVLENEGSIVAVGTADYNPGLYLTLAKYNSDGSLDKSFGGKGIFIEALLPGHETATGVAVQADGKIVATGYTEVDESGNNEIFLARYSDTGSLDADFNVDGLVRTSIGVSCNANSVAIQKNDGKIVVAGSLSYGGRDVFLLLRYETNGTLDKTFGSGAGYVWTQIDSYKDIGTAVAIQDDGKIVVAGKSRNSEGNYDITLVRYERDGGLDTGFGRDGIVTTGIYSGDDEANAVMIQKNGKIVVSGYSVLDNKMRFVIVRYNSDGSHDTGFGDNGGYVLAYQDKGDSEATGVAIQKDGKIVAAGYATTGDTDFAIVRLLGDSVIMPPVYYLLLQ